jgi:hypothetical protein
MRMRNEREDCSKEEIGAFFLNEVGPIRLPIAKSSFDKLDIRMENGVAYADPVTVAKSTLGRLRRRASGPRL